MDVDEEVDDGAEDEPDAEALDEVFGAGLSVLFKNRLGRLSSWFKSYLGDGWFLSWDMGRAAREFRLELLSGGWRWG